MSKLSTILALALSLFLAQAMFAGFISSPTDVCPAPNGGDSDFETVDPGYSSLVTISGGVVTGNTGCNDLITFAANGSITTTQPNANGFYDIGADDNLIGIINNTTSAITSINLSSATTDIFGFDGDGICGTNGAGTATPGYTFVEGNPCTNIIDTSFGTYGGPGVTYSNVSLNQQSGTVNFAGGIAPGGSAFFSLEGPVDLTLTVTSGVPEPATFSLMGIAVCGLFLIRRIRKA